VCVFAGVGVGVCGCGCPDETFWLVPMFAGKARSLH